MNNYATNPSSIEPSSLPSGQMPTLIIQLPNLPRGSVVSLTEVLGSLRRIKQTETLEEAKQEAAIAQEVVSKLQRAILAYKGAGLKREVV